MTRASIIINNYNYGRFLRDAVESALNQTCPHTEVIVVDDGSTDNSRQVIRGYGDRIVPVLKENGGQASALNAGFATCRGEVVIFLDSDDLLLPSAVERAVKLFEPGVVKVHWPLALIDEQGQRTGAVWPDRALCEGNLRDEVITHGPTNAANSPTSGNAWSREFLQQTMPIREFGDKHGADAFLFTLAPIFGSIKRINEPQGCYRLHANNYSGHDLASKIHRDLRRDLGRYDHHCRILHEFLGRMGINVDPETWKGPGSPYTWMKDMLALPQEVMALIPAGETFILIDGGQLGDGWIPGRRAMPFVEREGCYWGPPEDDDTAIKEFERLRQSGANFIVLVWSTFWWLKHYPEFHRHLRSNFRCIWENSGLVVFDLRPL